MEKLNKGMEHFWLAVVIASAAYAGYMFYAEGWTKGKMNLFIPAVALCWFLFRRGMRKRM